MQAKLVNSLKKQGSVASLKQQIEINAMSIKKLLRQSVIKSAAYIQIMLDVLSTTETLNVDEVRAKLNTEKDRYLRKNQEILASLRRRESSKNSSRSTSPRDSSFHSQSRKLMSSFSSKSQLRERSCSPSVSEGLTSPCRSTHPYQLQKSLLFSLMNGSSAKGQMKSRPQNYIVSPKGRNLQPFSTLNIKKTI